MNTKYRLRKDLKLDLGYTTLYRIERRSDGAIGGYIESEKNLDVSSNAWIHGDARVYGDARVHGNAWVAGNARVSDNAQVYGNAQIHGNAWVSGNARVHGDAWVSGDARVSDNAWVFGNAWVAGNARVSSKYEILNFVVGFSFSITITPDNIAIGYQLKTRKEWAKVSKQKAIRMGLDPKLYSQYKELLKIGYKMVPARKKGKK